MFSSSDAKFVVLAFSSLFSVINPIEAAPIFVSMTAGRSPKERRRMAFRASFAAALILTVFAATGGAIFSVFGITLPAFQIAGGILFTRRLSRMGSSLYNWHNGRESLKSR